MMPVGMAMLMRTFPPAERIRAAKILTIPTAFAPALGPVIGGLLVTNYSWEWVFFLNVPIGIFAIVFGLALRARAQRAQRRPLRPARLPARRRRPRVASMYALSEGSSKGWGSPQIIGTGVVGVALLVAARLRRAAHHGADARPAAVRQPALPQLQPRHDVRGRRLPRRDVPAARHAPGGDGLHARSRAVSRPSRRAIGVMAASQIATRLYNGIGPRLHADARPRGRRARARLADLRRRRHQRVGDPRR